MFSFLIEPHLTIREGVNMVLAKHLEAKQKEDETRLKINMATPKK